MDAAMESEAVNTPRVDSVKDSEAMPTKRNDDIPPTLPDVAECSPMPCGNGDLISLFGIDMTLEERKLIRKLVPSLLQGLCGNCESILQGRLFEASSGALNDADPKDANSRDAHQPADAIAVAPTSAGEEHISPRSPDRHGEATGAASLKSRLWSEEPSSNSEGEEDRCAPGVEFENQSPEPQVPATPARATSVSPVTDHETGGAPNGAVAPLSNGHQAQQSNGHEEHNLSETKTPLLKRSASNQVFDDNFPPLTPSPTADTPLSSKILLSREQRVSLRLQAIERKKDFVCMERVNGRTVNVVQGLELHKGVFSKTEQDRLIKMVKDYQEQGRAGQLRARTYSEPRKWMRGKGRVTIQFGCCYNYAVDSQNNPPGILREELVDPLPPLLRNTIRRLVEWRVIPESSMPDSCIINVYDVQDCIPPHIDHHDFVRPFCTLSLVSECSIVFGSKLKIVGDGVFDGPFTLPLPVGSVLILNGNGADIAKHAVPGVPTKRISITFRKMDPAKVPFGYELPHELRNVRAVPF